jgi:hypothetical protein
VKPRPVEADLLIAGGLTEMQLIFAFRDFANAPTSWLGSCNSEDRPIARKQLNTETLFVLRSEECT